MTSADTRADASRAITVALPLPLPHGFDYLAATPAPEPGCRVHVPFGRSHRIGIVLPRSAAATTGVALKSIDAVLDATPLFDAELLASLRRAADYWCGDIGEVLFGALPKALREGRDPGAADDECWRVRTTDVAPANGRARRGRSAALLQLLTDATLPASDLDSLLPGWRAAARRLAHAGLIERTRSAHGAPRLRDGAAPPDLNAEQQAALAAINAAGTGFHPFVLQGVTGSGKTEVYLQLTAQALAQGRQALWLVPEIGLVPQALRRLRARFDARIAVLHSNLAEGERARAWLDARSGAAAIVLGTRSAALAPLPRAGLIVVDEEHDASYKQQEGFRYHARDLALLRAQALAVPIVLGSATPALETLANVAAGRFQRVMLQRRVHARAPSPVHVLDLRGLKLAHGLSPALLDALDACMARGEQALVFKNRRGYAPVLWCHACGWHAGCARCDKPLTYYHGRAQLLCHHCGHLERAPGVCAACGAQTLQPQGQGTERLEEALTARYPTIPVLRVDRDSTRRKDAFDAMLDRLAADAPAILVGTQMLAKGHDLPNLTLVAIVGVDEGLHSIDFHAGERLAQLIVQVGGRAGRAGKPGSVWLQTHQPEHPLLTTLLRGGYNAAAALLQGERLAAGLPPFAHLALLRAECRRREQLDAFLLAARDAFAALVQANPTFAPARLRGPLPAPMPLRADRHRAQLLLEALQRTTLRTALAAWLPALRALPQPRELRWSLDVDPVEMG